MRRHECFPLETLFSERCPDAPGMWIAGGLVGKQSAVGVGHSADQAHARLLGEAAEVIGLRSMAPVSAERQSDLAVAFGLCGSTHSIAARDLLSSEPVWLPVETLHSPSMVRGPTSEGCGAGPDEADAVLHGLLELVERDAAVRWWQLARPGTILAPDESTIAAYRHVTGARRDFTLIDISSHPNTCVVAAVSFDVDGRMFACGTAAGINIESAALAALREMHQMEAAHHLVREKLRTLEETALADSDRDHVRRASAIRRDPFLAEACTGARAISFEPVAERPPKRAIAAAAELGFRLYAIDLGAVGELQVRKVVSPDLLPSRNSRANRNVNQAGFRSVHGLPLL